jgi:hypothetical protein
MAYIATPILAWPSAARHRMIRFVPPHLNSHHRRTVEKIFAHPTSANIEWREVEALLAEIGSVESEGNGKLHITVGSEPEVVLAPHHGKDASVQTIVELRGLLTRVGLAPPAGIGK